LVSVAETEHRHDVLVIEDDPTIRRVLCEVLTARGCQVVVARDSAEASAHLSSDRRPCILFVDTMLPGIDLRYLTEQLHLRPVQERVPVVALTASRNAAGVRLLGAVDCLEKPFAFGRVLDIVAKHCARVVRQRSS